MMNFQQKFTNNFIDWTLIFKTETFQQKIMETKLKQPVFVPKLHVFCNTNNLQK